MGIEPAEAGRDLRRAAWALHGGRVDEQAHRRVPATTDLDDVPQRRTLGAGDDPDAARKGRQRPFAVK